MATGLTRGSRRTAAQLQRCARCHPDRRVPEPTRTVARRTRSPEKSRPSRTEPSASAHPFRPPRSPRRWRSAPPDPGSSGADAVCASALPVDPPRRAEHVDHAGLVLDVHRTSRPAMRWPGAAGRVTAPAISCQLPAVRHVEQPMTGQDGPWRRWFVAQERWRPSSFVR